MWRENKSDVVGTTGGTTKTLHGSMRTNPVNVDDKWDGPYKKGVFNMLIEEMLEVFQRVWRVTPEMTRASWEISSWVRTRTYVCVTTKTKYDINHRYK